MNALVLLSQFYVLLLIAMHVSLFWGIPLRPVVSKERRTFESHGVTISVAARVLRARTRVVRILERDGWQHVVLAWGLARWMPLAVLRALTLQVTVPVVVQDRDGNAHRTFALLPGLTISQVHVPAGLVDIKVGQDLDLKDWLVIEQIEDPEAGPRIAKGAPVDLASGWRGRCAWLWPSPSLQTNHG